MKIMFHKFISFCQFHVTCKKTDMEKIVFCFIAFEPMKIYASSASQNDRWNFSFVTDFYVVDEKMTRNGCKIAIYELQILGITI